MTNTDPNLITSGLSREVTQSGVTVKVGIYRLEDETGWSLEVVNAVGTSAVWDDLFDSDQAAWAEFERTLAEEGMAAFVDNGNVIPFKR